MECECLRAYRGLTTGWSGRTPSVPSSSNATFGRAVFRFTELRDLCWRDPLHDRLEARVIAEVFEIRVVLDPVSHRYACFD